MPARQHDFVEWPRSDRDQEVRARPRDQRRTSGKFADLFQEPPAPIDGSDARYRVGSFISEHTTASPKKERRT